MSFCITRQSDNLSEKFPIKNIILCYLSGFHWLSNRQRLHRKYSISNKFQSYLSFVLILPLVCPSILNLALIWLVWMFCPKQSTLICPSGIELSCGKGIFFHVSNFYWVSVKLSLPAPLPPCFRKSVHNQIILPTNSILPPIIKIAILIFLTWI